MEQIKTCYHCGSVITDDYVTDIDGDTYCDDCKEHLFYCDNCEEWYNRDQYNFEYVEGKIICEDCFNELDIHLCEHCDEYHQETFDIGGPSRYFWVCRDCRDENYFECSDCEEWFQNNEYNEHNGNGYCDECYNNISRYIHDYDYKPEPEFFENTGENTNTYFGIELEIDGSGEDEDNAEEILDVANRFFDHIYIKHDGSLDDGFEIVSQPCTFEYHVENFPWKEILQKSSELGYKSHDSGTCGLHVHISREGFYNQEAGITKLLWIVEKFWDNILTFSRRTESQVSRWAKRYGLESSPELLKHKADNAAGRYFAINLSNYHTVELRIFRGTLNYNTFLATLQFCNLLIDICNNWSLQEIAGIQWQNIVDASKQYNELMEYLISKNLA